MVLTNCVPSLSLPLFSFQQIPKMLPIWLQYGYDFIYQDLSFALSLKQYHCRPDSLEREDLTVFFLLTQKDCEERGKKVIDSKLMPFWEASSQMIKIFLKVESRVPGPSATKSGSNTSFRNPPNRRKVNLATAVDPNRWCDTGGVILASERHLSCDFARIFTPK
jgi:hypothetical protein